MSRNAAGTTAAGTTAARWFAVRSVFRHLPLEEGGRKLYEERVVLVRAASGEEAMRKAENEARAYASAVDGVWVEDYVCTFELEEARVEAGTEVWSLMRHSALDEREYVTRFFMTGDECAEDASS